MKNPFRTKRIIISLPKKNILVIIPFLGKIKIKETKSELRGREIESVIYDEAQYIPDKIWESFP